MLFYHGSRSPYPWSLCWLDEFAAPTTARKLYTAAFPLVDITVVPGDEIVQHRRVALLELIQKHIRQRNLMGLISELTSRMPQYREPIMTIAEQIQALGQSLPERERDSWSEY